MTSKTVQEFPTVSLDFTLPWTIPYWHIILIGYLSSCLKIKYRFLICFVCLFYLGYGDKPEYVLRPANSPRWVCHVRLRTGPSLSRASLAYRHTHTHTHIRKLCAAIIHKDSIACLSTNIRTLSLKSHGNGSSYTCSSQDSFEKWKADVCIYIYVCVCVCVYIYIYMILSQWSSAAKKKSCGIKKSKLSGKIDFSAAVKILYAHTHT